MLIGLFNNYASELYLTTCYWQVDACEAKNQELMAENNDLRALLRSMQVDFHHSTVFMHAIFVISLASSLF